jgi:hypothetical protein
MLSLKHRLSIILAVVIFALSGISQPNLTLYTNSIDSQVSSNSLTLEKEEIVPYSILGCLGCSGNGNGPG